MWIKHDKNKHQIKLGDKVKCIRESLILDEGEVYTVSEIYGNTLFLRGVCRWVSKDRFCVYESKIDQFKTEIFK